MEKKERKSFELRAELRLKNERLVAAREELGLNRGEFAEKVGINYVTYCGYETMRLYPSQRHREILANLCGCSENEIFPPELKKMAEDKESRVMVTRGKIEPSRLLGLNRKEVLALPAPSDPEKNLLDEALAHDIQETLSSLPEREAKVLKMLYGFNGRGEMKISEVAAALGVTVTRIQQIRERSLEKLRGRIYRKLLKDWH